MNVLRDALPERQRLMAEMRDELNDPEEVAEMAGTAVNTDNLDPLPPGTPKSELEYGELLLKRRGQEILNRLEDEE